MHTSPPLFSSLALSLSLSFSLSSTGRWWVVGSAWTGRESTATAASSSGMTPSLHPLSSLLPPSLFSHSILHTPHRLHLLPLPLLFSLFLPRLCLSLHPPPPPPPTHTHTQTHSLACQSVTAESWVLELARNQRMNTDVRRNIFCVLVTSEASEIHAIISGIQ